MRVEVSSTPPAGNAFTRAGCTSGRARPGSVSAVELSSIAPVLAQLRDEGILTDQEFADQKAKLLA